MFTTAEEIIQLKLLEDFLKENSESLKQYPYYKTAFENPNHYTIKRKIQYSWLEACKFAEESDGSKTPREAFNAWISDLDTRKRVGF